MLSILLYHRVVSPGMVIGRHKIWVRQAQMEAQLKYLKQNGYTTITFKHLADPLFVPGPKHVILTFDDGYEDNYTILFPLLKKYGHTAVIYMVTGTDHNVWGLKEGEPRVSLMTHDMIREMAAYGIEFGGHTHTHIDLSRAAADVVANELSVNYTILRDIMGYAPLSFAYPFGGINEEVKKQVEAIGYRYAVATNTGAIDYTMDTYRIRRIEMRPQNGLLRFGYKVSGMYFSSSFVTYLCKKILRSI